MWIKGKYQWSQLMCRRRKAGERRKIGQRKRREEKNKTWGERIKKVETDSWQREKRPKRRRRPDERVISTDPSPDRTVSRVAPKQQIRP